MQANRPATLDKERIDLLETLAKHRFFLRFTTQGMTEAQAREHPTTSELCLGGIIKHVAGVESGWADFIQRGPQALNPGTDGASVDAWLNRFKMLPEETLEELLASYEKVAARTDAILAELPNLDDGHPLPEAPWFEKGATWSARRVLLHIIAETAQHAGHADIIRETIDGAKTMG
jgi:uncharacterized damage-inducible protein DinB